MIELNVIRDLVAIFGVIAGFSYYVLTVRNQQKSQRQAEETRITQLISNVFNTKEDWFQIGELMNMEWKDYDDFERKYGSDNNLDNFAIRNRILGIFNGLGYMLKKGMVEKETLELLQTTPLYLWMKFEAIIKEIRRRYNQPLYLYHFEYLAGECEKYMQEKGYDTSVPDTFYRYVPDK